MTNPVEVQSSEKSTSHSAENTHHATNRLVNESNAHAYSHLNPNHASNANQQLEAQAVLPTLKLDSSNDHDLHKGHRAPELLHTERFATQALRLLPKLDTNHDGTLSPKELKDAMQNPQFKGLDAEVVAGLYRAETALQNLSGRQDQTKEKGITAEDLCAFDKLYGQELVAEQRQSLIKDFSSIDANHDGTLSKEELASAVKNNKDAEVAQFFLDHFERAKSNPWDLSHLWTSGLNKNDIANFKFDNEDKVNSASDTLSKAATRVYDHQGDERSDRLWGPRDDFKSNIKPEAIAQGDIGDCFFLSSLAAVAKSEPEKIRGMIGYDADKKEYKVTFPGDKSHPVCVTAPTEMEQGLYNSPSKYGTWAGVLEKAYGKYLQDNKGKSSQLDPAEAADDGGHLTDALHLLTGDNVSYSKFNPGFQNPLNSKLISDDQLKKILSTASSKPVCCGTVDASKESEYPSDHAFTVIGFDPKGDNGAGLVTVRNPWGSNDENHTGINEMTFAQFKQRFSEIAYSQEK